MTKTFFGAGAVEAVHDVLRETGAQKILLVHGGGSFRSSGAQDALQKILSSHEIVEYSDFVSNPTLEDIERGAVCARAHTVDLVVAVGGGSALDVGKSIAVLAPHSEPLLDVLEKRARLERPGIPVVAIPTTAGTGSEVTQFAAMYYGKTKMSLDHPSLLPRWAIVDPKLTHSLPPHITASTGMDALSQAIESYWNIHSTDESKGYAREAIGLAFENLAEVVRQPTEKARLAMSRAAHLAGKAINITRTTACHAVSYPLTAHFGIPHGHAVSLTLPGMFEYNSAVSPEDAADPRGAQYVRETMLELTRLVGAKSARDAKEKISRLIESAGLERRLGNLGVRHASDIETIIQHGFNPERVKNNPRVLTKQALRDMLGALV